MRLPRIESLCGITILSITMAMAAVGPFGRSPSSLGQDAPRPQERLRGSDLSLGLEVARLSYEDGIAHPGVAEWLGLTPDQEGRIQKVVRRMRAALDTISRRPIAERRDPRDDVPLNQQCERERRSSEIRLRAAWEISTILSVEQDRAYRRLREGAITEEGASVA